MVELPTETTSWAFRLVSRRRMLEIYLWVIFAALASWPFTRDALFLAPSIRDAASVQSTWIFVGVGVLLFPILFQLIFGLLPFEAIRQWTTAEHGGQLSDRRAEVEGTADRIVTEFASYRWVLDSPDSSQKLLGCLSMLSAAVAKGIYSRSGVYLIVGVFIAFTGLLFFYSQTTELKGSEHIQDTIFAYAPRFGILFFIELIAFFFLRQYRAAMDEYRYYEAIQRHREELLALIVLSKEQSKPVDIESLLNKGAFYSRTQLLDKEQTTEILESRKLEKNELELLEKMVDLIGTKAKS